MLTEQAKQAILNGAYGVTREGQKAIFIEKDNKDTGSKYPYKFVILVEADRSSTHFYRYTERLEYNTNNLKHSLDIVGLWEDRLEPFNLKRALAGEPVKTRDGGKAYVQGKIDPPTELSTYALVGYGFNGIHKEFLHWNLDGCTLKDDISSDDIIGMWKEPEIKPATELPKPITEFGDLEEVYYLHLSKAGAFIDILYRGKVWKATVRKMLTDGQLYATKEDAELALKILTGKTN